MFRDRVRIKLSAGKGGDGRVAFGLGEKPMGGIGGNGGNVYLEADTHEFSLQAISANLNYRAEDGEMGGKKNLTGRNGADLIFKVPLATNVYNTDGEFIMSISVPGQRKLILSGGRGGLGNAFLSRRNRMNREKATKGHAGEELEAQLELELVSDIIFIGLPNAGKSSILTELTNADAKVAPYAFTTIDPQLGRMDEVILMDLPGLVEDTAQGKGLGTKFVKHTRRSKIVAHFVSSESSDPLKDYKIIRKELEQIDPALAAKPEVIILAKSDMVDPKVAQELQKRFSKLNPTIAVSIYDDVALARLKEFFKANL
jgi:GTP-binding protein